MLDHEIKFSPNMSLMKDEILQRSMSRSPVHISSASEGNEVKLRRSHNEDQLRPRNEALAYGTNSAPLPRGKKRSCLLYALFGWRTCLLANGSDAVYLASSVRLRYTANSDGSGRRASPLTLAILSNAILRDV